MTSTFRGDDPQALVRAFRAAWGREPRLFSAPGRVNIIGEHTDYNDGFVLPMAIERRTWVAAAPRNDRRVSAYSRNLLTRVEFDLDRPGPERRRSFIDYVEGIAQELERRGLRLVGTDMLIESDLPMGAGLSSSAALQISVGLALAALAGREDIDRLELALTGRAAEHRYVGTLSGIMDQFVAALGRANHALFIDCRTLTARPLPVPPRGAAIVLCDTKVKHELAASAYNQRHAECRSGLESLRQVLPEMRALRDITVAGFAREEARLPDAIRRRCRHVVSENARTLAAVDALLAGDSADVGRLMYASHESLRVDFEVSCAELDRCVEIAARVPGVFGARMTGGGFGGCTVNLVAEGAVEQLADALRRGLSDEFGKDADVFTSRAMHGACEHPLQPTPAH